MTLQKVWVFDFSSNFSYDTKRPLSTKEISDIGIFRFFTFFSKIWKIGER